MDVEYTWILWQWKNCRQFRLLTWNSPIGQFVLKVGEEGMGWKEGIVILARCEFYFILSGPSSNISIYKFKFNYI